MERKLCKCCIKEKNIDLFYISSYGKYTTYCKVCTDKKNSDRRRSGKSKKRDKIIKHPGKVGSPEYNRSHNLLALYGITLSEYDLMLIEQNDRCKICSRHKSEFTEPLNVDHDHNTGIIRGLLCRACNNASGLFRDDKASLKKAIEYLS